MSRKKARKAGTRRQGSRPGSTNHLVGPHIKEVADACKEHVFDRVRQGATLKTQLFAVSATGIHTFVEASTSGHQLEPAGGPGGWLVPSPMYSAFDLVAEKFRRLNVRAFVYMEEVWYGPPEDPRAQDALVVAAMDPAIGYLDFEVFEVTDVSLTGTRRIELADAWHARSASDPAWQEITGWTFDLLPNPQAKTA